MLARTSAAYTVYTDAEYIEDASANLVMTAPRSEANNNCAIQYRGLRNPSNNQWEVEYFCEPDHLLIAEDEAGAQSWYLTHLPMIDDMFASATTALAAGQFHPGMGHVGYLKGMLAEHYPPALQASIVMRDKMVEGRGKIETVIGVTNRFAVPKRFTYLYQDAAYMWFPDAAQLHVESVRLTATTVFDMKVNRESAGKLAQGYWQFVGTFHRERGPISGMLSFMPNDIAGISRGYLGFSYAPGGYAVPTPGFCAAQIPQGDGLAISVGADIVNRFIAVDLGVLAPGQMGARTMYRIATVLPPEQRNEAGIQAWIAQKVSQHYQGL